MDIMRDIPEHLGWIDDMKASGHVALLVGSDLARWEWRIEHPDAYDRHSETPICIWLAVVPVAETKANKIWRINRMYSEGQYVMHSSGAIHHLPNIDGGLLRREQHRSTMFVIRHGSVEELPGDNGWLTSTIPNENNIKILYFESWHNRLHDLNAFVSPLHDVGPLYTPRSMQENWRCYRRVTGRNPADGDWNVPLLRGPAASTTMARGTSAGLRSQVIVDHAKVPGPSFSDALTIDLTSDFPDLYMYYEPPDGREPPHMSEFRIPIADLR